jgi:regulator of nucleoside diphosphate kinase
MPRPVASGKWRLFMWVVMPLVAGASTVRANGSLVGVSAAVIVALVGWAFARFLGRCAELCPPVEPEQGGTMQHQTVRVTDVNSRRFQNIIAGRSRDLQHAGTIELFERRLDDAEIIPADRIGPDIVTMNSEVRIDLDSHETIVLRLVFPNAADATAGQISVLAPLGMAVLGRRVGDRATWHTPGGFRSLRVDHILYQPEREGLDIGARPISLA